MTRYEKLRADHKRLPYGRWRCADGREVLFNRGYTPLWPPLPTHQPSLPTRMSECHSSSRISSTPTGTRHAATHTLGAAASPCWWNGAWRPPL